MERPSWLALLAPIPADVVPERKPVASAGQIAQGAAGPIAGWENVSVNLSHPGLGLRHLQLTLDASGTLIAAGDHVMLIRETTPDGAEVMLSEHESIGGRYEADGSFNGTRWHNRLITIAGSDDHSESEATSAVPSAGDAAALRQLADEILSRANRG